MPFEGPVLYEVVDWREESVQPLKRPSEISAHDVSASGMGLVGKPAFRRWTDRRLMDGRRKLRVSFRLPGADMPLYDFARLIWRQSRRQTAEGVQRTGLQFVDVSREFFETLKAWAEERATDSG